ncbi:MAG: ATP-binding protein [Cyanobacteria bacterium P01_D01_bin.156]
MIKTLFLRIHTLNNRIGINRSIAKKISFGYALALGTAVIGTSGGLLGGYYGARPARQQAQYTLNKKQLLNEFNNHFLSIQLHPQRLLAVAGESRIWVQYETNQFNTELRQLWNLIEEIEQLTQGIETPDAQMFLLLSNYHQNLRRYETFVQNLWLDLNGVDNKAITLQIIAADLSGSEAHELFIAFEQLSEDLTRLRQMVEHQHIQSGVQLQRAEKLQRLIILSSMAISIAIAIILAIVTSRAIASPVEQLTQVAQQVTQENNFQLQASVQTQDEVSLLAQALNQLVSWAGQYTMELEESRQTLEDRVAERTEALQQSELCLRQQTEDLQHTLSELQKTQLQLVQSEKMSSLGQMVAGIAHEINNPISFIHGNIQYAIAYFNDVVRLIDLYQQHYPEPKSEIQKFTNEIELTFVREDFPRMVQSMKEGSLRISEIVASLRTFSRLDEAVVKHVDIHEGLDSTLTILNSRLRSTQDFSGIEIIRNYGPLPKIECYAGQLNQVFMNIFVNAIDALEEFSPQENPKITVSTFASYDGWVVIEISDNGPGMTDIVRSQLFDPFYTNKPVGKGTGLGLSISYQIVTETHSGYLTCESDPGQGAKFIIKLPAQVNCDVPTHQKDSRYLGAYNRVAPASILEI